MMLVFSSEGRRVGGRNIDKRGEESGGDFALISSVAEEAGKGLVCDPSKIFREVQGEVIWCRRKGHEGFERFEKTSVEGGTSGI